MPCASSTGDGAVGSSASDAATLSAWASGVATSATMPCASTRRRSRFDATRGSGGAAGVASAGSGCFALAAAATSASRAAGGALAATSASASGTRSLRNTALARRPW